MIKIFKGCELFDRVKRTYFKANKDFEVKKYQRHEGHIRFYTEDEAEQALALTYKGNRGKYKFLKNTQQGEQEDV